jgi:outer membrane phospholipase A
MKVTRFFVPLLLLLLASRLAAWSGPVVTSIFVPPSGLLNAGGKASIWLYCVNNLTNEDRQFFDLTLEGTLSSEHQTNEVVLNLNTNSSRLLASIPPGGLVREEYLLDIPAGVRGEATLAVANYNPLTFFVTDSSPDEGSTKVLVAQNPSATIFVTNTVTKTVTNSTPFSPFTKFVGDHLFPYEPIYFLLGSYPAAEFQLSLKYRLFDFANKNSLDPLGDLYFAYTQVSYWDLLTSDPSFYDTSYKPSVFYYRTNILQTKIEDQPLQLDLQAGAEHESNGRGGTAERSLYTAYLQPTISLGRLDQVQLAFQPRAMYYLDLGNNNPDLSNYRGYADLVTTVTRKGLETWQDFQLATKVRVGDYGSHTSVECDLRFNVLQLFHFAPSIDIQYFAGYGQTLRQYNEYSHGIRAGLCLYY